MSGGGESQPIGHAPGGDGMPLFHAGPVRAFDDEEMKTWVTVYPAYIDSTLKLSAGRKISKEDGVEAPHPAEIMEVLKRLKLTFYIENKKYPKQWWVNGRFRVRLKTEDGFAKDPQTKEEYKTRKTLLRRVAQLVPNIREIMRKNAPKQQQQVTAGPGAGGGGGKKGKKKGKKGRR